MSIIHRPFHSLFWGLLILVNHTQALCFNHLVEKIDRKGFIRKLSFVASSSAWILPISSVSAATTSPKVQILNTPNGVKYAIVKKSSTGKAITPQAGDFVAIEYTGYLTNGQIFDSTHAEGKGNALLFKLGSKVVIPGINEVLSFMEVGQKVQAIIPPTLAFGSEGICLKNEDGTRGDCLIPPDSTLVYDITLKKTAIPPP